MDRFWIHAANYALEHKMPVLGICRGLQLVNVAFGGSLYQDLSYKNQDHMLHSQKQNRDYLIHQVTMDADSHLASILGAEPVYTNTMHHQCVKEPGKGLKITAHTADGIPEAMETDGGQFILVQWHPEELQDSEPRMRGLFKNLIEKSQQINMAALNAYCEHIKLKAAYLVLWIFPKINRYAAFSRSISNYTKTDTIQVLLPVKAVWKTLRTG